MKRGDKSCKIVREITSIKFELKKGIFPHSQKICFSKKLKRSEQEKISKCLKEIKVKSIWGDSCLIIR